MRLAIVVLLATLVLAPSAGAWKTTGRQWHTGTIRYANIAPDYEWSLSRAVAAWNASGARVSFVRAPRAKADLVVGARLDAGDKREAGLAQTYSVNRWISSATVFAGTWGLTTSTSFDHKAGITSKISNVTGVGFAFTSRHTTHPFGFTWTGGTPTAGATNTTTGLLRSATGGGFLVFSAIL